jgi:hypothetical protein
MDPLGPHPLIRSFERHHYAENRSSRTVTTYLIAVWQADTFLLSVALAWRRPPAATSRRSLATCSPAARPAPPRPTTRSSRSCMAGWPKKRRSRPTRWPRSRSPSSPSSRSRSSRRGPQAALPGQRRQHLGGLPRHRPAHVAVGHRRPTGRDGRDQAHRRRPAARRPPGAGQGPPRAHPAGGGFNTWPGIRTCHPFWAS